MSVKIDDVKEIVAQAGALALRHYGTTSKTIKADRTVVTEADAAVEGFLKSSLTALAPRYGYLGEETPATKAPAPGEEHLWVVDALDGSRAYSARMPLWMPAVCLLKGARPVAGAAVNPVTNELFWADREGPAYCNDEALSPTFSTELAPNTFILGPTNHHRAFAIDFPGRVYCLGAPIYQLCLVAKGAAAALFFDPAVKLWDLALPSLLLERTGAVMVYASGRPVAVEELMDRRTIPEPLFAGGAEMVDILRRRISYLGDN